jgi:ribosomal protein S18 acetylase RimI-like enzyme
MRVEHALKVTPELHAALEHLVPQLSARRRPPTREELEEIVASPATTLLVARDERILGVLTLVLFRIPTGLRARIEDVVVDSAARGRGAGEALVKEALEVAATAGAVGVELTSAPSREAANRLYRRLGFEQRETNVYVWTPR